MLCQNSKLKRSAEHCTSGEDAHLVDPRGEHAAAGPAGEELVVVADADAVLAGAAPLLASLPVRMWPPDLPPIPVGLFF